MRKKGRLFKVVAALFTCALVLTGCQNSGSSAKHQASSNYKPVRITERLTDDNSGPIYKYTIKKMPNHVVVCNQHLANIFFDLHLAKHMAAYVPGLSKGTTRYPEEKKVKQIKRNNDMQPLPKEAVLKTGCDFLVAWGSTFSNGQFNPKFCKQNGIIPYKPSICGDNGNFEDLYQDYHTLGKIFKVQKRANQRVNAMKSTIKNVHQKLGNKAYSKPLRVLDLDFIGPHLVVVGVKGMPETIIKDAGGESVIRNAKFSFSSVSWEQIVKSKPDVIVINNYGIKGDLQRKENFLKKNAKTKNLRAVKKNRIYGVSSTDMVGSAGSAKVVEQLAKDFYPNKF